VTVLFEDRSRYDAAKDSFGVTTLQVEHHPKQADSIKEFLAEVSRKAGVYFAEIRNETFTPAAPEPAVESGEAHGEQPVRTEQQPEAAEVGARSEPEEGGTEAGVHSDGDSELAWTSGEEPVEGQGERDS
jgi:hypothetical protein